MPEPSLSVVVDGRPVEVRVRRSRRARHVRLRVGDFGAEVVLPWRAPRRHAETAVTEHHEWLCRAWTKHARQAQPARPPGQLLFRGAWTPSSAVAEELLGHDSATEREVFDAVRRESVLAVRAAVAKWSAVMGVDPAKISVRDQRSKWGACTSRGTVTFNWRLLMAPPDVLEYVVVHELAHLREMNHSPRFWAIVREHCPDFAEHKRWLRENGASLRSEADPEQ